MRTWYGAPSYFVLGAVHAIVYWVSVSVLSPFILLVSFFNARRRLLHDMAVGAVVINNAARAASLRAPTAMAELAFDAPKFSGNLADGRAELGCRRPNGQAPRDPAFARYTAVLSHRPVAVPLSRWQRGAEGVYASRRRARG